MAGKARRNFTDEFKAQAAALLENGGRPLAQMSQELGVEQSVSGLRAAGRLAARGRQPAITAARTGRVCA